MFIQQARTFTPNGWRYDIRITCVSPQLPADNARKMAVARQIRWREKLARKKINKKKI